MTVLQPKDRIESTEPIAAARERHRHQLVVAAAIVLVVLLLAITPPLLNVSRYQRRIASSMSQSIGRPVHMDKISLHLLPVPGFTIQNLVVSEDPAFGNEPMIRANEVIATLRVSSLWQRRVEFSRVNFHQPSVNLVRNPDGRWNLEGVLLHAAHVDTAPTVQQRPGPAPRFPYIEATAGRINLKLGQEKMPFSLTDTDFALWLPSAQTWRVRLEGRPMRTDSNIGDPGTVRLEGSLERAARMEDVPVDLHASWYDAPLGEASRLVSADDRGWRGTLHADGWLRGPLASATVKTSITLDDLRRADFVPARSLDESISCTSTADLPAARFTDLACKVPVNGAPPLELAAQQMDLTRLDAAEATVQARKMPLEWVFGWMRLFSPRIPPDPHVPGTVDASLLHTSASPFSDWNGTIALTMPVPARRPNGEIAAVKAASAQPATPPPPQQFEATLSSGPNGWSATLSPTTLRLGPGADLNLTGEASARGYSFALTGDASPAQLAAIAHALPQLADDTALIFPGSSASANTLRSIALPSTRVLSSGQVCSAPAPQPRRPVRRNARLRR